jgi:hypothetical protein
VPPLRGSGVSAAHTNQTASHLFPVATFTQIPVDLQRDSRRVGEAGSENVTS